MQRRAVSGTEMLSSLKPSMQRGEAIDNELAVEAMLVDTICGDGANTAFARKCLEQLPTAETGVDLGTRSQHAVSLSHRSLCKLAPKSAQMKVSLVLTWVGCMLEHRLQELWAVGNDAEMQTIIDRFAFCFVGVRCREHPRSPERPMLAHLLCVRSTITAPRSTSRELLRWSMLGLCRFSATFCRKTSATNRSPSSRTLRKQT